VIDLFHTKENLMLSQLSQLSQLFSTAFNFLNSLQFSSTFFILSKNIAQLCSTTPTIFEGLSLEEKWRRVEKVEKVEKVEQHVS
jgi:hypothetical protein